MSKTPLRTTREVRTEQLEKDPAFRAYWQRTALARAVALAVIGYRAEHQLTQTRLAQLLGVRQPHVARLELGEHTPSLEMLQRLSRVLGLRFIVQIAPASDGGPDVPIELPAGVKVVEDLTAGGSRVLVAAG
jgi:DNA-binding XRE family transcriptional regulator